MLLLPRFDDSPPGPGGAGAADPARESRGSGVRGLLSRLLTRVRARLPGATSPRAARARREARRFLDRRRRELRSSLERRR